MCVPVHAAHAHLVPIAKSTSFYLWKGFSQCFFAFDRFKIRLCATLAQHFEIRWLSLKVKSVLAGGWRKTGFKCFKMYLDIVFSILFSQPGQFCEGNRVKELLKYKCGSLWSVPLNLVTWRPTNGTLLTTGWGCDVMLCLKLKPVLSIPLDPRWNTHKYLFSMLPSNYFDNSWDKAGGLVNAKQAFHSLMGHFFITLPLCQMCPGLELSICE